MTRKRVVQRRRLTGRLKANRRLHVGSNHPVGTEAGVYTDVISRISNPEQADELINHLEGELQKTKSPALKRRLRVAIASTREWKAQLQLTTTGAKKKTRPQKPRQLYMGMDRKITDQRPLASPPSEEREEAEQADNSYE